MRILVCSKISIPAKDRTLPAWEYLRSLGHEVIVEHPKDVMAIPDVIISMGVTVMLETLIAIEWWPNAQLYCYNWDCYEWVWTNPRENEYDYNRYGELLKLATEVWVPSYCTGRRTTQWWGIPEARTVHKADAVIRRDYVPGWYVILSACPWWEYDDVRDEGYALCTLRAIPDPHWDWFERACEELGIPYLMTKHEVSYEEYQEAVAHCRFLVSHCYELSTGGLTLMEGYYLGKPCLLSDSPWHGGRDYMGSRAQYFRADDKGNFKRRLREMYDSPPSVPPDHKEWIITNFSDKRMIDDMLRRIHATSRHR